MKLDDKKKHGLVITRRDGQSVIIMAPGGQYIEVVLFRRVRDGAWQLLFVDDDRNFRIMRREALEAEAGK